jgi:predicted PurR-regulated permease PerM
MAISSSDPQRPRPPELRATAPSNLDRNEVPPALLPSDPQSIFVGGLFFIALFAALYLAREIVWPITLALVLKLMLQPAVKTLERIYVPRMAGALIIVLVLIGTMIGIGMLMSQSTTAFFGDLAKSLPRLREDMRLLLDPLRHLHQAVQSATNAGAPAPPPDNMVGQGLISGMVGTVQSAATGLFTTVLLLFFFLLSGDTFLRRLVEIVPRFSDKRQLVEIVQHVERDIAAYLGTVSAMNLLIGIATGIAMWLCGLGNPVLWGVLAFLLNFIPILGPFIGILLFIVVGVVVFGAVWYALVPGALYFGLHVLEGELVTPMLLARRFTLNPVLVMVSLVFWYWMWGAPGGILAIPLLAIAKIICDRVEALAALGHFLGGDTARS